MNKFLYYLFSFKKIIKFFNMFFIFYWSRVDLQSSVSFRCTEKWFGYIYVCVYIYIYIYIYIHTHTHTHTHIYIYMYVYILYIYILFQILFHYRLLQDIEYSSLCSTVGPCSLSTLYTVLCICWSHTPNLSLSNP